MNCEREDCGHPLALHNPCSACPCPGFEPDDRRMRAAQLTDFPPELKNEQDLRNLARETRGNRTYSTKGKATK